MNDRQPDVITVVITRVDGGVSVMRVITAEYAPDGAGGRVARWTVDPTPTYIASLIAKHNWQGPKAPVSWRIVPNDYVDEGTDRYFRNAWKDTAGKNNPDVDMPKAREIHRDKLRALRVPLLAALDTDFMRAIETNDRPAQTLIAAKKQVLRDVTADPRIDAATTPEELKAVIPAALIGG